MPSESVLYYSFSAGSGSADAQKLAYQRPFLKVDTERLFAKPPSMLIAPPSSAAVLAAAKRALAAVPRAATTSGSDWSVSTLFLGAMRYHAVSKDPAALQLATAWAEANEYRIDGDGGRALQRGAGLAAAPCGDPPLPACAGDDSCRVFERDISYNGGMPGALKAATAGACCAACQKAAKCEYFTWTPSAAGGGGGGRCFFSASRVLKGPVVPQLGARSGWTSGGPAPPNLPVLH